MAATSRQVEPARVAEPGEGISLEELALASRNHAMPAEALRDELTPAGLHYVLCHYDIPAIDPATWRLRLDGCVERALELDLQALQSMPSRTVRVTMECAGNGRAALAPRPVSQPWLSGAVGTAEWTGVPLADLLRDAAPTSGAVEVAFTGADHGFERGVEQDYERALPLGDALADDVLVAYAMNGAPLPVQHGFPARLVVPGWYGMAHVKWLVQVRVLDRPYDGYQNTVAYRLRQEPEDPGDPVSRIEPRALLLPPGDPDFLTRERILRPGRVTLSGRAWSGWGPVVAVSVSTDDGDTWREAEVESAVEAEVETAAGQQDHRWAWRRFTLAWDATPGTHVLRARATDSTGREQPIVPQWNLGGFANNADQPVVVLVLDS
ncbi:Mo-co oxidoreductase dimerisation domain-containing protein [Pedococcus cremeus]|uniref:Mo-co oxidoreductase dimerisation domain-containing protein n=1 Tax=Pedococcus cremeus TaxID=587636 RepID=A0A1H9V6S9_9MICO|nr:sulfite oxidase [Pedococcus cremeus]SES17104.1 Mo-co oxidoreductase dimerisation domain-containing protein [Pedococcus cremeus]